MPGGARTTDQRDVELIGAAGQGDRDAFDALILPRLDRMFRMAVAITRNEADARDAVQDACVQAWRELPRLREPDRFDSWVDQVVVNAARMLVRGRGRRQVREVAVVGVADGAPTGRVATIEPSTPAESDRLGESDAIRRAFERLDGTNRALLVLHHVERQGVSQIARTLGIPVGTVKWRLWRARAALERELEVESR